MVATCVSKSLFLMVLVNCPGCNKQYEGGRSISAHQRGPCGVAAKGRSRKQRKNTAKVSREVNMTDEALLQLREDLREEINPFEADDEVEIGAHGAKHKSQSRLTVSCL